MKCIVNKCPHKDRRTNLTVPKSSIKCNYNLVDKPLMEFIDCSIEIRNLLAKHPRSLHKYHVVIDYDRSSFPYSVEFMEMSFGEHFWFLESEFGLI